MASIARFIEDEAGVDLIEYALLAGLVAAAGAATLTPLGTNIAGLFTKISTKLSTVTIP